MPSDKARYIINETICGIENLFCQEFPKREGYIISYGDQIDALLAAEREACARLAAGMGDGADCDDRGMQDPETGEVPCSAERRGEVCVCVERSDLAHKIATKIRARGASVG